MTDATVIESIAQNHILGKLEPSVQEPAKLLQLTGKCTLESNLELVNSKSGENPYMPIDNQAVVASAVSNTSKDCTDGRIDKLESMVEKLCVQVVKLTDNKPNVRKSSSSVSCSHCGNIGHTKQRCYKLKDCYQCGRKGHIAKHCRDKNQAGNGTNRMNEMSSAHSKVSEGQCADIAVVPRIMLQAEMGGAKIPLLYDPGSMYSMITRAEFERLPQKPPLMPASRSGIGISGEKFELDGVAHLNIRFYREDGSCYLLEYQPVLVSSKIKSNILGMQTELQFKGATRDHLNRLLTFIPHNDVNITLKYWKESSNKESSCVQVAKATIVPTNSVKYVRSKIINANSRGLAEHPFIFTPSYEMHNDVKNFIKNCDICLKVTAQKQKFAAMGRRDFPSKPLEKISIDFLVDLPCTRGGNCHILVVNDCFSKYIQLYPIKDRLAKTAAACLVDYIMRFGIPGQLLSDQDPAYESTLFQELMRGLGITKLRTTAYNPRSNGLTEQANATVKLYLTSVLTQNKQTRNNWDQWLREACFAYNTSVHTSTGFTPAELMFGRKFRVLLDLLYGTIPETNMTSSFDAFRDIINSMYAIARDNMAMRQDRYATSHDEKIVRDDKLLVGDRVYLYLPRLARVKLTPKWNGPFKVMKAAHPVYTVSIPTSKGQISKTVTRDKLKRAGNTMNLVEINLESEENQISCIQPSTTVPEQLDESSDDDEPANRYNLRPRRNIVNYNRELVSYIAAFR